MEGLTLGRIAHYVIGDQDVKAIADLRTQGALSLGNPVFEGMHMPMMIVGIFPNEFDGKPGVNGQVFLDGPGTLWVTSIKFSEKKEPKTWHWIEKA